MRTRMAAVLAATALVAGCEEDEAATESAATATPTATATAPATAGRAWDQDDLVRELGLRETDGGRAYEHAPTGCDIETLLINEAAVTEYSGDPDRLATMPDGTAGVVVEGPAVRRCTDVMRRALAVVASGEKVE
jgi:hypothetical protein